MLSISKQKTVYKKKLGSLFQKVNQLNSCKSID
nr:MAG TPA: hypothetical protein [Bacteriophage sp.]